MKTDKVIYQNQTFEIVSRFTYYILRARDESGNEQYFNTSAAAKKAIGLPHDAKTVTTSINQ